MNYNKLVVLATAGLILAVAGVGNAFAATWGGTDASTLGSSYPSWDSGASGYPNVARGADMTWDNTFTNGRSYSVYPKLVGTDQNDQNAWNWNGDALRPGYTYRLPAIIRRQVRRAGTVFTPSTGMVHPRAALTMAMRIRSTSMTTTQYKLH